jgi:hypothetical protein
MRKTKFTAGEGRRGAFTVIESLAIPEGGCLVISDGEVEFCGPIDESPAINGAVMVVNPREFDDLQEWLAAREATKH